VAIGAFEFGRTFRLTFAADDVDFLNRAANALAGKSSLMKVILTPQGEHFVPVISLLMVMSAKLFGVNATPLRLLIFASHLGSALFAGLTARRLLSRTAGFVSGAVYVAACGLSSLWLWIPIGGSVPLGVLGITGGILALAYGDRLGMGLARALALAGSAWALLCDSTLAPLALAPFVFDALLEWRKRRRVPLLACLPPVFAVGMAALASILYSQKTGLRISIHVRHGVPRGIFLLAVAPFRFFFPSLLLPHPMGPAEVFPKVACVFGLVCAMAVGLLLVALHRSVSRALLEAALATGIAAAAEILLIGIGRWQLGWDDLFQADRYFFTLLFPFSLIIGVLVHELFAALSGAAVRRRLALVLLAGVGFLELELHRVAMFRRVPFAEFDTHARVFSNFALLADGLTEAAIHRPEAQRPARFPDTAFFDPDVHNNLLTSRLLLFVLNRHPTSHLQLGGPDVEPADQQWLDPILQRWCDSPAGQAHRLTFRDGRLIDEAELSDADFRVRSDDRAVVGGLFPREASWRWMGPYGQIRLRMNSPTLEIMTSVPMAAFKSGASRSPIVVHVFAVEESSTRIGELGNVSVHGGEPETFHLAVPPPFWNQFSQAAVRVTLQADRTWRPIDVIAGSGDFRDLSIMILRVRFLDPATPSGETVSSRR
jgi:hypothetical protein